MTQSPPPGNQGWGPPPSAGQGWSQQGQRPPPKKRPTLLYVLLGAVVLIVAVAGIGALAGGSDDDVSPPKKSPTQEKTSPAKGGARADVEITNCTVNATTSWPEAKIRITNHSSKTSDYTVNVEFIDSSGERIDEGLAGTTHLAPKQVAKETASGLTDTSGPIKCWITDVDRWAS
ncbi:FxLYD domain-containing protein [Streptomyces sp. NPDC001661]